MSAETPEVWSRRHRKVISAVLSAAIGVGLALLCPQLPASMQVACRVAARVFGAFT